jgi:hypothetical protein
MVKSVVDPARFPEEAAATHALDRTLNAVGIVIFVAPLRECAP